MSNTGLIRLYRRKKSPCRYQYKVYDRFYQQMHSEIDFDPFNIQTKLSSVRIERPVYRVSEGPQNIYLSGQNNQGERIELIVLPTERYYKTLVKMEKSKKIPNTVWIHGSFWKDEKRRIPIYSQLSAPFSIFFDDKPICKKAWHRKVEMRG